MTGEGALEVLDEAAAGALAVPDEAVPLVYVYRGRRYIEGITLVGTKNLKNSAIIGNSKYMIPVRIPIRWPRKEALGKNIEMSRSSSQVAYLVSILKPIT